MKKGIGLFLVIAVVMALIFPLHSAKAMPYFEDATIIGDEVNMRMRPTTDAPIIMTLMQGDRIGVFCEETEGWYRIIYGNYRGYISEDFVFLPSTDHMVGNVKEDGLKVRQNPGGYSHVVATLSEGTGLNITNISGEWYYIEVPALSGRARGAHRLCTQRFSRIEQSPNAKHAIKTRDVGRTGQKYSAEIEGARLFAGDGHGVFRRRHGRGVKAFQKRQASKLTALSGRKRMRYCSAIKKFRLPRPSYTAFAVRSSCLRGAISKPCSLEEAKHL